MSTIIDILNELNLFSLSILKLEAPIQIEIIAKFERTFNLTLPNDYKAFLEKHNGLNLMGTSIYGIVEKRDPNSLEGSYLFEHFEVNNPMPRNLVPFSPDGGGSHYCFNSSTCNDTSSEVVFWQHDYLYSENDPPEVVNNSFVDWVKEVLIDWTLENYDYFGNPK